ncbi:MAG: RHS repeat protein [Oligoflexia bacterium]|nr:RHS repeat protein [Oligoflexia bacterium]
MLRTTLLLIMLFTGFQARALVDLKNANYSDTWADITLPGSGFDLKIERTYNSRTLFNGMFGFGWCADFETSVEITAEGNLRLLECGAGGEVLYHSRNFSEKDIDKTVKTIIGKVKTDNPVIKPEALKALEVRLKNETVLRGEYALKFGIVRTIADKTRFFANGRESEFIEKSGPYYSRVLTDGTTQKFNMQGKLEKVFDKNGNSLTLTYDGRRLRDVMDSSGRKLSFKYYENGKVQTITGPNSIKAEYKFKNLNDLIFVKAASGNIYTYEYDDLHNMLKVTYPDKSTKALTYNKNFDWVTSHKDRDGCLENYEYVQSDENPKDHFWANVIRTCQNKTVLKAKYEFWYEWNSTRTGKYLKKGKTVENNNAVEVSYNELGKPLNIARQGKNTRYEYYDNGLLKKKTMPDGKSTIFSYDPNFKKVNKVINGNLVTNFNYDNKGNLTKATNSLGQAVVLSYDPRGRIIALEDQAKRKVLIQYDERFGKPQVIEREGLGKITVAYDKKGGIEKVSSPEGGPTIAIQVATAFGNLLDLIQPAGVTLSL